MTPTIECEMSSRRIWISPIQISSTRLQYARPRVRRRRPMTGRVPFFRQNRTLAVGRCHRPDSSAPHGRTRPLVFPSQPDRRDCVAIRFTGRVRSARSSSAMPRVRSSEAWDRMFQPFRTPRPSQRCRTSGARLLPIGTVEQLFGMGRPLKRSSIHLSAPGNQTPPDGMWLTRSYWSYWICRPASQYRLARA